MRIALALALVASPALAGPPAAAPAKAPVAPADAGVRLVEEAALGMDLPDHPLLAADLHGCGGEAAGAPVFWAEVSKAGRVSLARVHGAGSLDACLEKAIGKAKVADKLPGPVIIAGHIEIDGQVAPRVSTTPVILDAHHTKWQVTATSIHYTANRMMDIAAGLDAASDAVANCAGKRTAAGRALVWYDGKGAVRSGTRGYDDCVAKALGSIKLPAKESAFWLAVEITPPGEQLAPRVADPHLSHEQALKDAVATAVRSRKLDFVDCENAHPKAALTAVSVSLYAGKLTTKKVTATDPAIEACVKGKLDGVKIPNASPSDKLELDVDLPPGT